MKHSLNVSQKNDGTTAIDADWELVMLMYNLAGYSSNYSDTTNSLQFSSKDETTNFNTETANINNSKFFKYKTNLLETTVA